MYWERSEDVEVRSVYKAMSRNRYVEIKRFFHLANNEELDANREEKGQSSKSTGALATKIVSNKHDTHFLPHCSFCCIWFVGCLPHDR